MYYFLYTKPGFYSAQFIDINDIDFAFDAKGMISKDADFSKLKYLTVKAKKGKGDYLNLSGKLYLFNNKIVELISKSIFKDAEFQDVMIEGDRWNLLNYKTILNCLDLNKSEYILSDSGDRYIYFEKIVLNEDKIADHYCFLIPEMPTGPLFFTEKFKLLIEKHSGVGMHFVFADRI